MTPEEDEAKRASGNSETKLLYITFRKCVLSFSRKKHFNFKTLSVFSFLANIELIANILLS